ncbi:MAG: rhodanese-like domain-containing protein [Bacteroidota bacterium]
MMKLLNLILVLGLLLSSCSTAQQPTDKTIDFDQAQFIDVRTPDEFNKGSFEDAKNIPLSELQGRISEIAKNKQTVVFCRSGSRSAQAIQLLKKAGYNNIINGVNTRQLQSLKEKQQQ